MLVDVHHLFELATVPVSESISNQNGLQAGHDDRNVDDETAQCIYNENSYLYVELLQRIRRNIYIKVVNSISTMKPDKGVSTRRCR